MHDFQATTFMSPTYCGYCGGFLWGLTKQGVECKRCRTRAHRKCARETTTRCNRDRGLATLIESSPLRQTSAMGGRRALTGDQATGQRFWRQVDEERQVNVRMGTQAEQPLSLFQTLPSNFMQFTAKLAPVTLAVRGVRDIVLWQSARASVISMAVYSVYCLRPNLLFITPLGLAIVYVVWARYMAVVARAEEGAGEGSGSLQGSPKRSWSPSFSLSPSSLAGSKSLVGLADADSAGSRARARGRRTASGLRFNAALASRSRTSKSLYSAVEQTQANDDEPGKTPWSASSPSQLALSSSSPSTSKPRSPPAPKSRRTSSGGAASTEAQRNILGVATLGSTQYTENVHTTQNLTGTYVMLYDSISAAHATMDWDNPALVREILFACVTAQLALMVVVYWVPWYILFLVCGNSAMAMMSPHVRAFLKTYGADAVLLSVSWVAAKVEKCRRRACRWLGVRRGGSKAHRCHHPQVLRPSSEYVSPMLLAQDFGLFNSGRSDDDNGFDDCIKGAEDGYRTPPLLTIQSLETRNKLLAARTIGVFENQRWWVGLGWIPRLTSGERGRWSDESGKRQLLSVQDFQPDPGFGWIDEWEIDMKWASPMCTDLDGWIYTDNNWKHPRSTESLSSYTRRRKWIRRMKPDLVPPSTSVSAGE